MLLTAIYPKAAAHAKGTPLALSYRLCCAATDRMGRPFSTLALRLPPRQIIVGALAGLALVVGAPHVGAQASLPIVQARPDTGSRIRRELVKIFIPAEKRYDELTPDQKAKFLALFSNLGATDEPPYPADGLRPLAEAIVVALADGPVGKGTLFVTVHVDEQGDAKSTAVYETPGSRVSREVATVLMKAKYKPAKCNGTPCSSEFPFTARFDVD
jgi:hypothetical protein